MDVFILVVLIIIAAAINRLYHKIFTVTYFSFKALAFEWLVCFILAMMVLGKIVTIFQ